MAKQDPTMEQHADQLHPTDGSAPAKQKSYDAAYDTRAKAGQPFSQSMSQPTAMEKLRSIGAAANAANPFQKIRDALEK